MLTELLIRGVGVIDDVALDLAPGLNVLTGETGAGKTMVVSALELLLGGRADADRVRAGAPAAIVEARLTPPPAAAGTWVDDGDDELVVAREVVTDRGQPARSRARLGGRLAPVSALAACLGTVVELHGQSETARLAQPAVQRELLDRCGGPSLAAARSAYRASYDAWRAASEELTSLRDEERERAREVDRLRYELDEVDAAAPEPGEEDTLTAELGRLEHAEALAAAATEAAAAVTADGGARDALGAATAALRRCAGVDPALDALAARLAALASEAQEAGLELRGHADGVEADPARLEALRERQAELARLTRKYGSGPARPGEIDAGAVVAYADRARRRLAELESVQARADVLAGEAQRLEVQVGQAAGRLREERRGAGQRLAAAVAGHLAELAMAGARVVVEVDPVQPGAHGADRVAFLVAADPGQPPLPVGKGASGGERSRIALAVRLALADADDTPVLVFDEVDAGIGGATALAVGRKLARLARGRQVLCVTHLAQLAAFADAHFSVEKAPAPGGRVTATVRRLDEAGRVRELSRMLSGTGSELAASHAAELRADAVADAAT